MNGTHATIIAKAPVAGRVKTRLCPPCTAEQAAAIAAAALADTIDAIDAVPGIGTARRTLLLDGHVQPWMSPDYAVVAQRGDDLGDRLRNGFADLGPGVIIGMETPHVAHLIGLARQHVANDANVIGLADDGGYWTIGLCNETVARIGDVFAGIPISTSSTGQAQLDRLRDLGRPVVQLPRARDLDTIDDLRAVAASGGPGRLAAIARATLADLAC